MIRAFLSGFLLVIVAGFVEQQPLAQSVYDLPNDNNGCPTTCRQIPWQAGSDLWNGGILPTYIQDPACVGLLADGITDNTSAINKCIASAVSGHAVFIPAGTYYVAGRINMQSNVVLRGAKSAVAPWLPSSDATQTTLKLGTSGQIYFAGGSTGSDKAVDPASNLTKGTTTIIMAAGHGFVAGDWLVISEFPDPNLVFNINGCTWCGFGSSDQNHFMTQVFQATNVTGNTVTLSRPLYYTFQSSLSPVVRKLTPGTYRAGLENMRLDGSAYDHPAFIYISLGFEDWVKGVETYLTGSAAKAAHVYMEWSYGLEIRDGFFHHSRDVSSDHGYGAYFFAPNSDHKIENNIFRNGRHHLAFEGGGSGIAVLYNYSDNGYTDDPTYLGNATASHGPHPYMNLFEGNVASHLMADHVFPTSSHNVFFRNWFWGDASGPSTGTDPIWGVPNFPASGNGYNAIDVGYGNLYYSFVGNVLGVPASYWGGSYGATHTVWTSAQTPLRKSAYFGSSRTSPVAYSYETTTPGIPVSADATSLNHGNYDYQSLGVAYWEGGTNHTLLSSIYYSSKPVFFGSCVWPAFGPDLKTITNAVPAKTRFAGDSSCNPTSGTVAPPQGLSATVN